jgi:hypothetical protein
LIDWQARYFDFLCLIEKTFAGIRKTVAKNLSHLVIAFLLLARGEPARNGRISIAAISRAMIVKAKPKNKYKRLNRFLDNPRFNIEPMIPGFLYLIFGKEPLALIPLVFDQTTIRGVEAIYCSVPFAGRALPIGLRTFEYGLIESSQNDIEWGFFMSLIEHLPDCWRAVFILDRGYSRVDLFHKFNQHKVLFIIRGRRNISVKLGRRWLSLGRLKHREGRAVRYRNVLLRRKNSEAVDIIIYREKGFKEPWFLIVPVGSEEILPTEKVVEFYRERMQIEVKFRDLKTHLGVRGLQLEVRKGERLGRLLIALALVYIILVVLGAGELGAEIRPLVEVLRPQTRHGTRRTLSVLLIGCRLLADPYLVSVKIIINTLKHLSFLVIQGKGFISLFDFRPP